MPGPTHGHMTISDRDNEAIKLFEQAIEKETHGMMTDAVVLYRQAFKLNDRVDLLYRSHSVPRTISKLEKERGKNAAIKVDEKKVKLINVEKLIASYAHAEAIAPGDDDNNAQDDGSLTIKFANLGVDNHDQVVAAPVSPLMHLPNDIWFHILQILVRSEPQAWFKFSITCKKNAYLGFGDSRLWHYMCNLAYGNQVYFENQQFLQVVGNDLDSKDLPVSKDLQSIVSQYNDSWKYMLFNRPFIKFLGCYISVVNYYTEGCRAASSISWNTPIRSITYYRYLRFYPDGTVLKCLTVLEPTQVIPYLLRHNDNLHPPPVVEQKESHHTAGQRLQGQQPTKEAYRIYRGKWTISTEGEAVITIENGSVPYYRFFYHFQVKNLASVYKHNKLTWIKYYAIRKRMSADDDREGEESSFGLRNEKPFKFLRVLSYTETN